MDTASPASLAATDEQSMDVDRPQAEAPPVSAPIKRSHKRKANGAIAADGSLLPVVPQSYNDSQTLAAAPQLVATPLTCPITDRKFYNTRTHPTNKLGFRYYPCGPSPNSTDALPLHRVIESPPENCVRFSWEDRSPYIYLTEDGLTLTTDKGFRAARANVPLREGTWYFEIICGRAGGDDRSGTDPAPGTGPHVRLGIGRRESGLNAPVGFDGFSYGVRDRTGDAVTLSTPKSYGPSFSSGDVVGILVHLPTRTLDQTPILPNGAVNPSHIVRRRVAIRTKGQLYFEAHDFAPAKEMTDLADAIHDAQTPKIKNARQKAAAPGTKHRTTSDKPAKARDLPKLSGSSIWFFKNGKVMNEEPAFADLYDWLPLEQPPKAAERRPKKKLSSTAEHAQNKDCFNDDGTLGYYPFVSCYGGGIATLNAGPDWRCPPSDISGDFGRHLGPAQSWRPLSERQQEYMAETRAIDEREEAKLMQAHAAKFATLPTNGHLSKADPRDVKRSNGFMAPSPLSFSNGQDVEMKLV